MFSKNALLLVAHPGHELLLHGWLCQVKPIVCVLTDGSGHGASSRLHLTRDLLASAGARAGTTFGRFTDREIYSATIESRADTIVSVVEDVAETIVRERIDTVVADAMEGFNPVHDLCRIIAGAACELAGAGVRYEYPVHAGPEAYDQLPGATVVNLDDAMAARKLDAARAMSSTIPDIAEMLDRWGASSFRREAFLPITDWTVPGWPAGERPLYERIGEERVAAGRYDHVIRYGEHFRPLLDVLRSRTQCVS